MEQSKLSHNLYSREHYQAVVNTPAQIRWISLLVKGKPEAEFLKSEVQTQISNEI